MAHDSGPRVLFFVPYGSWWVHNQLDCIIGTALRLRGADAVLLTCDGLFQEDCYVLAHSKNQAADCAACSRSGKEFFSHFPLPLEQLRPYTREEDENEIEAWLVNNPMPDLSQAKIDDLPIGEWVRFSVRSYHVVNPRNLALPHVQALFRRYIKYAWRTYRAAQRFFDAYKPNHVFLFGGYGFLHGPVYHLATNAGCKIVTHERGQLPSRFILASNGLADFIDTLIPVLEAWDDVPFSEEDFTQLRSMFTDWEEGKNRAAGVFIKKGYQESLVRRNLEIPQDAKIVAAFTSGEHELPTEEFRRQGGQQLELINYLIEIFREREEYLVIRHHPNLGAGIRSRLDYNFLTRAYRQLTNLPPNVRIIMPNEEMTSYSLLWNASAIFAFMSTLAIESVARGLPVATMPLSGFNRVGTHTIDDFSLSGMAKITDELLRYDESRFGITDMRKAYAFSRAHNLKYCTLFKSFGIKDSHHPDIRITDIQELAPGNDVSLDRVCDYVFKNTSIFHMPSEEDKALDPSIEKTLFTAELERVRTKRKIVTSAKVDEEPYPKVLVVFQEALDLNEANLTRAGLKQQRGAVLDHAVCNAASTSFPSDLHRTIASSNSEYLIITNGKFIYDDCFSRSCISLLMQNPEKTAVLCGAWLQKSDEIVSYVFTDHNPIASLSSLNECLGHDVGDYGILGFGMFKTRKFLELFDRFRNGTSVQSSAFEFLKGPEIVWHQFPKMRYSI